MPESETTRGIRRAVAWVCGSPNWFVGELLEETPYGNRIRIVRTMSKIPYFQMSPTIDFAKEVRLYKVGTEATTLTLRNVDQFLVDCWSKSQRYGYEKD